MKSQYVAVLLSLLLGGCAQRPARVPAGSFGINLGPVTLAEAEPAVRESCENSILQALLRHGFTVEPGGTHVDVEVAFWQDPGMDGISESEQLESSQVGAGALGAPRSRRSGSTADLTAIIHLGPSKQTLLASGTAQDTEQIQNAGPTGGRARSGACAMAAERLADAMVEVMTNASR